MISSELISDGFIAVTFSGTNKKHQWNVWNQCFSLCESSWNKRPHWLQLLHAACHGGQRALIRTTVGLLWQSLKHPQSAKTWQTKNVSDFTLMQQQQKSWFDCFRCTLTGATFPTLKWGAKFPASTLFASFTLYHRPPYKWRTPDLRWNYILTPWKHTVPI